MADIELPQLGESVTEGTITRWFKAIGEHVEEDEPLFEVSTDKVDSEVPSPVAGYLTEILVEEGDTVDVGTKVAVLSDAPPGTAAAAPPEIAPAAAELDHTPEPGPAPQPYVAGPEPLLGSADVEPPAYAEAPEPTAVLPEPEPEAEPEAEPDAQPEFVPEPEPEPERAAGPAPAAAVDGDATLLSPVVRRLLADAGVDPAAVKGTGIGGRITRADAEAHVRDHGGPPRPEPASPAAPPAPARPLAPATAPAPPAAPPAPPPAPARRTPSVAHGGELMVPLNKIRKITAEHMVRSKATSPHVYVSTEVDYEGVERVRQAHKAAFRAEEGVSLTYLPFVARALIDALADFPHVNASMGEEQELVLHGSVHLGIAVDLDHEGLIVPVVHDAQDQRLPAIARSVADLAGRAKSRSLTADDITGGTVTITNVGSTGNLLLLPIINQPQVMILSTDGVKRRPVVVTDAFGNESIAIHSVGNLTLGWDHRAFDGAYAAEFLALVRDILETRDWEAEL